MLLCLSIFNGYSQQLTANDALVQRISNHTSRNIVTEISESSSNTDFFEISSLKDKTLIKGNNPVSIATGLNWYLKYGAGIQISWNNLTQDFPDQMPGIQQTIRKETTLSRRYYLNYCTFSYTMAFWDWDRWEKELDWMALHGVNLALSITGNETVWYNVLKRAGYSTEEINEFIAGPAYIAWWQMNNLEGWGGPNPDEWYKQQEILQKKILARMKELGIQPVLPGYAGMVPRNIGGKLGYRITDPGTWCTFNRPAFLSPDDPNFTAFATMYYEEMEKLYGKADYYAIDPFHEGGNTKNIDLDKAGKTIMSAMKQANPKAVWVAQAWQKNPREKMIAGLNAHDLLVLDLYSEKRPQWGDSTSVWKRSDGFGKHDWMYCMLLNFGGRVGLHGKMNRVINGFYDARAQAQGQTMLGVGVTAEGIENNPVMYELLYELPWRDQRFTKNEWLAGYTRARYGKSCPEVDEAWTLLSESSYNCPDDYPGEGAVESVLCARPHLPVNKVSTWGDAKLYYDSDYTRQAAKLLLDAAPDFAGIPNFEYDLTDVLRQSIADKGNVLLNQLTEAYRQKQLQDFQTGADEFLKLILYQDELLSLRSEFSVGSWLEQAKSLSENKDNQQLYEWNARTLITVWGNRAASETGGLHDYSHREWSGLLSGLYYKRWKLFFDATIQELEGKPAPAIDFFEMENQWTHENSVYPVVIENNLIDKAAAIYKKVFE
ncbi:MAG: alpha-N-acetylglucosaminidase [Candidatus Symbiothrix sp.]|nr:alpha-N-acetylglucosaminidase [Candidatus Symbiothrix sp.]